MELESSINRENIIRLMALFYSKAMRDDVLGPFFTNELGDDIEDEEWVEHIELLADFWLATLLGEKTYKGNFIGAHIKIANINKESFIQWIQLFSESADEIYVSNTANLFKNKGKLLSQEFMQELML